MHMTATRRCACGDQTGEGQAGRRGDIAHAGGHAGCGCHAGVRERPRYFPGQLITADDLALEADYFRDLMRRHNVWLHGWGVVCGALVCVVPARQSRTSADDAPPATEPWLVCVEPGHVLGPYGDEIVIDQARVVDLRGAGVSGCDDGAADDTGDPWCSEVYVDQPTGPRYVAVRYQQCRVRPVLAQPAGCACDDLPCEYSRYRDGYEIGVIDHCPASHQPAGTRAVAGTAVANPTCPSCPDSGWVALAEVTVDGDGTVTAIDNCSCRRIVTSARDTWQQCDGTDHDHPPQTTEPQTTEPQTTEPQTTEPQQEDDAATDRSADGQPTAAAEPASDRPRSARSAGRPAKKAASPARRRTGDANA